MINKILELNKKLNKNQKYEIAIILCILFILFVLFYEYMLAIVSIVAVCYYYIKELNDTQNKKLEQVKLNRLAEVEHFCYSTLFEIFRDNFNVLSIIKPNCMTDIIPQNYRHISENKVIYRLSLIKDKSTSPFNKVIYKSKINALIENYVKYSLFSYAYYNDVVALRVVRVLEDDIYIIVEFIFIDNDCVFNSYKKFLDKNRPCIKEEQTTVISNVSSKKGVLLCYHQVLYEEGNVDDSTIFWDYNRYPHMLVVGSTGSGKTTFNLKLLEQLQAIPSATIYISDFKGEDFNFLSNYGNYFSFEDCSVALDRFAHILEERRTGVDTSRTPYFLLFDEVGAFLLSLDKKEAEDYKKIIANILMIGRGLGVQIILSLQRADASFFTNGARDNFSCILALGNMSKEAISMLFADCKDEIKNDRDIGTGYLLIGGNSQNLATVISPNVTDKAQLQADILRGLTT